jgi:hypothetical protein
MKKIFYFLAFMGMSSLLFAQSVALSYNGNPVNNNDTIFVGIGRLNAEHVAEIVMRNTTSDLVKLRASKEAVKLLDSAIVQICMVVCLEPSVDTIPENLTYSLPGETTAPANIFTLHYNANGNQGVSLVRYTLFNADDMSDNVVFYFTYNSNVSISDSKIAASNIAAYPNPATDRVTIKYSLNHNAPAKLVVKNLMGTTLYTTPLYANNDKVTLDVSQYASGIYFYSLVIDEHVVSTKKLLVR